jgi:hypothetical protein
MAGGAGTNAALQKMAGRLNNMQKVESMMPKAPKPVAEVLKGPEPDFMRVYSGQRIPIEGKFDIMRADPHASMGRAFYTAELPRYANKFTGNQPGANVTPVDVDRNRMLMFDKMYDTPQGQMEGLDYYDMLRRQAMVKPGIGKDMIRQEILDAGFAGTQMPNATGKAYAIYDPSVAQDMSGRGFARGGLVDGSSNDDATGGQGWRAAPGMAAGGTPYKGINPMATGLGKMLEQSKVRKTSSDQMARSREAKFANQEALRLQRQKQLAAAKTARLNALAPKLSTYVPPASGATVGGTNTGVTTTPPPGSSAVVDPGTNTAIKTVQPSAEPKVQASAVPSSVADIAQNLSQANQTVASMTPEEYAQAGLQSEQLRKERFLRNVDALKEAFPNDWWNRDIASYYGGKDTNWLNETMKGINAQGVIAKNAYENPTPLSDADWYSKTGTPNIYRDPKSGYGISVDDGKLNYYNPQGNRLSRSILSAEDLYKNASQYGIDLSGIGSLGQKLDAAGIRYKPGELYAGTGSNLGVNFADVAAGKLGSAYDWTQDPFASQKGSSDRLAESQALAQKLGIDLTKSENLATLSPQLAGDVTRQFVVSTPSISGSPTYSWYDTQQAADQAAQQYGGTVTNLAGQTVTPPKGARGGLVSMAGGGLAKKAADKAFKALPGQSFQGKSGLNMEMPKDIEKRILEITETGLILPSEALGKHEGKTLMITQADRTKVGEGFLGGPGFSGIQLTDPRYAGATWGVKTPGVGQTIIGSNRRVPEGQAIWTTMLGTPTQHKSNQMVFDRLYKEFMGGVKQEKLTPELKDTLNAKLASVVDKEGKNLFPADVDITNPRKFRKLVDTFDKRAAAADVMGGIGVGGKKGQIFDYDRIIQRTTDPALLEVPTGSLGNRLFQLSGEMMDRPDLHPAFPTILKGEDLGVSFMPAPRELLMEDYINKVLTEKGRQPGYMDWTRGYAPSQFLSEELLTKLQKAGYKKGGKVKKMQAGGIAKAVKSGLQALDKPAKQTITSAVDPATDLASRLTQQGRTSILPIPNRWFLQPEKFPQMQGLVEKVLQVNNMQRSDFPSGAFVNPRTGEILDKRMMEDVGVVIDPKTNRPIMSAKREIETDLSDRKKGSITKSNLVRRQLYKPEGDPLLDELKFIATIEQSGAGHKYGLGTEYATPVEMFNTMTGENPTLRPKSRGDIFGIGDIVGRVTIGKGQPHDVYESLLVAPKGSDVEGVKLSKKKGGMVRRRK